MWSRGILKSNAKDALRVYYWPAVLVCLIAGILSGSFIGNGSARLQMDRGNVSVPIGGGIPFQKIPNASDARFLGTFLLVMTAALALSVVFILLSIFVGNIITVGKHNYFLESRYQSQSAGVGRLFYGFSGGYYVNIMKCMFFRDLYTLLWSLLLVLPGIYKHYEYYMVPYLIAEYPDMDRREAFQRSKEMMDGNKFDTWVLELSFIGWLLLSSLLCGIGLIFLNPYYEATFMELYLHLKQNTYGDLRQGDEHVVDHSQNIW